MGRFCTARFFKLRRNFVVSRSGNAIIILFFTVTPKHRTMKKIEKSIVIKASAEKLWEVLTLDRYTKDWYSAFSPGSYAVTDWKPGSKVLFMDQSKRGMAGKIVESIPGKSLIIEYTGLVQDGREDLDSAEAQSYKGGRETYRLSEGDGATLLDISSDMDENMFNMMSERWEKAFERLKALAENQI